MIGSDIHVFTLLRMEFLCDSRTVSSVCTSLHSLDTPWKVVYDTWLRWFRLQSNLSWHSYYAEAYNKLMEPNSASWRPGDKAAFEELLQRWWAVGSQMIFESQTFRSEDKRLTARPTAWESRKSILQHSLVQTDYTIRFCFGVAS